MFLQPHTCWSIDLSRIKLQAVWHRVSQNRQLREPSVWQEYQPPKKRWRRLLRHRHAELELPDPMSIGPSYRRRHVVSQSQADRQQSLTFEARLVVDRQRANWLARAPLRQFLFAIRAGKPVNPAKNVWRGDLPDHLAGTCPSDGGAVHTQTPQAISATPKCSGLARRHRRANRFR